MVLLPRKAIEYVTKEDPEFGETCLDFFIEHINDKAPRVKLETARIIGNITQEFPDKVKEAVPKLLENTKDKGTVVRWSAAFALTEIAKVILNCKKSLFLNLMRYWKENLTKVLRMYT